MRIWLSQMDFPPIPHFHMRVPVYTKVLFKPHQENKNFIDAQEQRRKEGEAEGVGARAK